jgi:hypothetical protein
MSWTLKVVNGDVVRKFSNNGYDRVTDLDKLKQECRMILTTDIRPSGLGASLRQAVGRSTDGEPSPVGSTPLMFQFQMLVKDALDRYRYVQRNFQYSRRTFKELLDDFSPVQIWGDTTDPRVFRWRVDFFSVGNLPNFALGGTTR